MVFSSVTFLFMFLPAVFLVYLIAPGIRVKNAVLILASLLFYAWGEQLYVLLMLASVFCNWLFGLALYRFEQKKNLFLALAVILNIGMLFVFKYTGFFCSAVTRITGLPMPDVSIHLPIGISFFTFQVLSYVIDVGRNRSVVQKSFFRLLLYISLFPQLIAGPIVKYHDISEQLLARSVTADKLISGLRRFAVGLSKKILIADVMAKVVDDVFAKPADEISGFCAWTAAVFYVMQIYFDFSGYSDMAIGLGRMFGFEFKENFHYPYASNSMREFWRRWHISLSTWFREYLYIPLGGNRKGEARTCINLLIVFLATGIWHGANFTFILWGIYNGLLIVLERIGVLPVEKIKVRLVGRLYTMFAVVIGFTVFRADSLSGALAFLKQMFSPSAFLTGADAASYLTPFVIFIFAAACIACLPVAERVQTALAARGQGVRTAAVITSYVITIALLAVCLLALSANSYSPFIYFRF